MIEKKKFLLRLNKEEFDAIEKWAADDFRSVNAQIEFLLNDSLKKAGRLKRKNADNDRPQD
ncbi:MAG: Arc family DNA-binding protein [Dehalococcoidia bacterium]|nr:Arc family DNA-binding protein [Dehalococcoidia bacterium]